jgi:hypothetical protein
MRHSLFLVVVFSSTLLLLLPQNSFAQNDRPFSFNLKFGKYSPKGDLNDTEDILGEDFDDGPNIEISFAHRIFPNFGMEYSLGILSTDIDDEKIGPFRVNSDITSGYLLVTAQSIHQFKRLEIYGGGGLGIYFVSGLIEIKPSAATQLEFDDHDNIFGAHFLAGLKNKYYKDFLLGF